MTNRPPRTTPHQKEQPDAPGRWWFCGLSVKEIGTVQTVMPVQNRPFEVVLEAGEFFPTVPETGFVYNESTLIGWWTEEEKMGVR